VRSELDDGAEACVGFIGAQGDALELLEFAEEALDQVPPFLPWRPVR
jgi:hypothetical protein